MRTVFADTSFFIAFLVKQDQYAQQASEFIADYDGHVLTTTSVLMETGNHLARSQLRTQFAKYVNDLRDTDEVEILAEASDLWDRALELYVERPDKSWSLTDCLSFVVMQDRELTEALTADHHFEQAGFTILLK